MRRLLRHQHGNAMVEMSLILPILVLMLLAVADVGLLVQQAMTVADSARAGAAFAVPWANATNTAGMAAAAAQSAGSIPGFAASASIACRCASNGSAAPCSNRCSNGAAPAEYAEVTATASIPLLFGVQGLPARIPIRSIARMRTAWPGPH